MPPRPYQRRPVIEENENEIQLTSPTTCACVRVYPPAISCSVLLSTPPPRRRAIASLLPCGIGERIPRFWSVPPSGIYLLSDTVLRGHFRYLGRTSAFVICGEITAGIKAGTKTTPPDGRRNLIRSDTPRAFLYTDFRSTPRLYSSASIVILRTTRRNGYLEGNRNVLFHRDDK